MTRPLPCAQRPTKPKTAASIRVLKTTQRRKTKKPKNILMGVPSKAMAICDSEPSLNLLPPPSDHMGEEIQNPLLPCAGTKKRRVSKASFPPRSGQRGKGIRTPPPPFPLLLLFTSPLPRSLPGPWVFPVPSLGRPGSCLHSSWASQCPSLGTSLGFPGPSLGPPWASLS